jgi:hypothetical protein
MLDKSHSRLMTFLNTHEINSMLDYDTLDIGTLDITASPLSLSLSWQLNSNPRSLGYEFSVQPL